MILPRAGKSRNVDGSTHRGRGHHPGEVHQVNDEPSWPRNRQTASLRFVHPCTSGRRSSRTLLESQPWPTSRSNDPFRRRLTQSLDRVKPNVKNSSKRRGVETTNASWRRLRRFRGQSCREVSTNRLFSCHNLAIEERLRPMAFVGRERVGDAGSRPRTTETRSLCSSFAKSITIGRTFGWSRGGGGCSSGDFRDGSGVGVRSKRGYPLS